MQERRLEVPGEREVELVVQRAEPLRAATACETYARPRPSASSSKRVGEQRRELVAGDTADARAEHRHERPARERPHHLVVVVLERRRRDPDERALLAEDRAVERLQLRAGLDAELLDERPARVVVGRERLRLAAAAVERQHQLPAQPLAQRVRADERLELGDQLGVRAELEIGCDPLLEHAEPQILEPVDLGLRERLRLEVGERRAAPQVERLAEQRRLARPARADRASRTSRSNRVRSSWSASSSSTYPVGRVRSSPAPSSLRSCETAFCSDVIAVRGGCSPQSWSTSRSVETGSFARRSSSASRARWFRPPSGDGLPRRATSSGPRILNSSIHRL